VKRHHPARQSDALEDARPDLQILSPDKPLGYSLDQALFALCVIAICQEDCEGIVGKYRRGTYAAKPVSWVKVLNPDYTQKRGRKEMFEGFREPSEQRPHA
jgi:hypothetical protein